MKKKKILIGLGIVLAIAVMVTINVLKAAGDDAQPGAKKFTGKAIDVEASKIIKDAISSSVLISGGIEEVDEKKLIPSMSIKIDKVLVKEGTDVTIGTKLFEADMSSLEDELTQLGITYDIQKLQLQKLENMTSTTATSSIQIGVELSRLSLASAQRAYDNQVSTLEKNQILLDEGVISQSEFDGLNSSVVEAESQLRSARLSFERSESDVLSSNESTEIDTLVQLKNLESLDLNIAKLEKQMKEIKDMMVSEMAGMVTFIYINEGETAQAMSPMMIITDTSSLKVVANVREYDVKEMAVGQQVIITGDAIGKDQEVVGQLSFIAPVAEVSIVSGRETTAVKIEVEVTEGAEFLKPGYTVDCEVTTELVEDAVIASYSMFNDNSEGGTYVFVVTPEGGIVERDITLGITSDFDAQVTEGLEAGEVVITNPSLAIKDGMRANVTSDLEAIEEGE